MLTTNVPGGAATHQNDMSFRAMPQQPWRKPKHRADNDGKQNKCNHWWSRTRATQAVEKKKLVVMQEAAERESLLRKYPGIRHAQNVDDAPWMSSEKILMATIDGDLVHADIMEKPNVIQQPVSASMAAPRKSVSKRR